MDEVEVVPPDSYRVDHLLLLVGANPLPNAVVGPLLVKPNGHITLLYSKASEIPAKEYLKPVLEARLNAADISATVMTAAEPLEESRQPSIWKVASNALNACPNADSIGLNYTGGTKAMSVHTYRAVLQRWAEARKAGSPTFTYLSPRDLLIYVDMDNPEAGGRQKAIKTYSVSMCLEQMLELHGGRLDRAVTEEPFLAPAARAIAKISVPSYNRMGADWTRVNVWNDWRREYLKNKAAIDSCPEEVLDALTVALRSGGDAATARSKEEFDDWLKGDWLESYVLDCLRQTNESHGLGLHDVCMNVYATFRPEGSSLFEVDVIGIRGYQLFGISCASVTQRNENDEKAKWKLFEAILRARQIGGDEARVAFVTLLPNSGTDSKEGVEREAQRLLQRKGIVKVFGRTDLDGLEKKLARWIQEANEEVAE
jgi:hypothetical protein